ncbi:uncharacterized protein VTP21DRAFT_11367 [Calcarisporiella thermophila]|uniref:uncharacterized protein n=1 Tax=Calcarisporiella thermophila TaxID=911321 RepID=UPI0037438E3D
MGKILPSDLDILHHSRQARQHEEELFKSDIELARRALDIFINTRMNDAEALLLKGHKKTLYSTFGYSILLSLRALLTFKPDDIEVAVNALECSMSMAARSRRSHRTLIGDIILGGPSIQSFKKMSMCQRHAELIIAEACLLLFALTVIQRGDQPLIKEALYLKRSQVLYSAIQNFAVAVEEEYEKGVDIAIYNIDKDFYSGITYGSAIIMVAISYINMLHRYYAVLLRIAGFRGNREYGLELLKAPGGWREETNLSYLERAARRGRNGLRHVFCDGTTTVFHVVVSTFVTNPSYHLSTAVCSINSLLMHYERSIIFLYIYGAVHMLSYDIKTAISVFEFATNTRQDWRQTHHGSRWYLFLCYCIVFDWERALSSINILATESMWSKATYCYHKAVVLYMLGAKANLDEAIDLMAGIGHLVSRYGRICLPIEKFVARKARKFCAQGNRLFLPMFELMYIWNCFNYMNVAQLNDCLTMVSAELSKLRQLERSIIAENAINSSLGGRPTPPPAYPSLSPCSIRKSTISSLDSESLSADSREYANYWDDYCLGYMLKGIIASKLALHQHRSASIPHDEYIQLALTCFDTVIKHSSKIVLDHYIFYFTRFERARMNMYMGKLFEARKELNSLKNEDTRPLGKGHYSFKTMLKVQIEHTLEDLKRAIDTLEATQSHTSLITPEHEPEENTVLTTLTAEESYCSGKKAQDPSKYIDFFRQLRRNREISTAQLLDCNVAFERYTAYDKRYPIK